MQQQKSFRILIMGLPSAGKTTLANKLMTLLHGHHLNADKVREEANDWDFTDEGRIRQAKRMHDKAEELGGLVVADFVCPTPETRAAFDAHITIWMNTIDESNYEDTNAIFVAPAHPDFTITGMQYTMDDLRQMCETIMQLVPQGVMIGRYQPFHDGHKALFEAILAKHGYVTIMVRWMPGGAKNPLSFREVIEHINKKLFDEYKGKYCIMRVPNVAGVYYGRDVGYAVEKIELPDNVTSISATAIRKELGITHPKERAQ